MTINFFVLINKNKIFKEMLKIALQKIYTLDHVSFKLIYFVNNFLFINFRNSNRNFTIVRGNPFINAINEFSVIFVIIEVFSLSLFSITTIRFDFPRKKFFY